MGSKKIYVVPLEATPLKTKFWSGFRHKTYPGRKVCTKQIWLYFAAGTYSLTKLLRSITEKPSSLARQPIFAGLCQLSCHGRGLRRYLSLAKTEPDWTSSLAESQTFCPKRRYQNGMDAAWSGGNWGYYGDRDYIPSSNHRACDFSG